MSENPTVRILGRVSSPLTRRADAPCQGDEGGPEALVHLDPDLATALRDVAVGHRVLLLTWLDRADRSQQVVRPRGDPRNPELGVFATRSPYRPNPIGLHEVTVLAIEGTTLRVSDLEALDGTPVIDLKPVLGPVGQRCHDGVVGAERA